MHNMLALTLCCAVLSHAVACCVVLCCAMLCCAQVDPSPAMIPGLQMSGLDLETVVSPSQAQLPGLYKGHDVFLFTSRCVYVCVFCGAGCHFCVTFLLLVQAALSQTQGDEAVCSAS